MGLCMYLLNEWMYQRPIGFIRTAFLLTTSRNQWQERGVFNGTKTDLKKGRREVGLKSGAISGRLGLGGAPKQRPRVAEHSVALDRWGKKPWKKGNAVRQWLDQWLINFSESPKYPGGFLDHWPLPPSTLHFWRGRSRVGPEHVHF